MITAMWRPEFASLHKDVDAQKVADEILGIGEEVTAEEVVNAARDESCELHKCFEWDNSIAAEKWRTQQARVLFAHLIIRKETEETKEAPQIRLMYNNGGNTYKSAPLVFSKPDEYKKLLAKAYAELHNFKLKYAMLKELKDIFALIQ